MRYIPTSILAACAAVQLASLAQASPTVLRSPDTAQTYADNTILWQQIRWLPGSQQLVATITFSNADYVSDTEPRHDETFTFSLPGVKFDAQMGTFSVRGLQGRSIPVAVVSRKLFVRSIELLPSAQLQVKHRGGHVGVNLVADLHTQESDGWIEIHR